VKKPKTTRKKKHEKKLTVNGSFLDVLKASASAANKKVKAKKN
jgi:hypothetical protein